MGRKKLPETRKRVSLKVHVTPIRKARLIRKFGSIKNLCRFLDVLADMIELPLDQFTTPDHYKTLLVSIDTLQKEMQDRQ